MTYAHRLSAADLAAFDRVQRAASDRGVPVVLVGAGARLLRMDWPFGVDSPRTTRDWDFAVEVPDFETYEAMRRALAGGVTLRPGTVRVSVTGVSVDLLPFGPVESLDGTVYWSSVELDVCGMTDAKATATPVALADGLSIPVPTIPALAALKCVAFEGRGRSDDKDLRDLHFIASAYDRCGNEGRVFDELGKLLAEERLSYHLAGPTLLGRDIARQCSTGTVARVERVIANTIAEAHRHARSLFGAPLDDEAADRHEAQLVELFTAIRDGISSAR